MKSSKRRSSLSTGAKLAAVALVFAIGIPIFKQTGYKMQAVDREKVLGSYAGNTTTVSRQLKGVNYLCKRTDCDVLANDSSVPGALDITANYGLNETSSRCNSAKDRSNRSICYWSNPTFTHSQCNVDKTFYRNKKYKNNLDSVGGRNQALSEDSENVVYYDCTKIAPTPKSNPTPTRKPTPRQTKS